MRLPVDVKRSFQTTIPLQLLRLIPFVPLIEVCNHRILTLLYHCRHPLEQFN